MKTKIILASFLFATLISVGYSQTEKGTFRLGGSLGLNNVKVNYSYPSTGNSPSEVKSFGYGFSPTIAYSFIDRLSTGLSVAWSNSSSSYQNQTQNYDTRNTSFGIGPAVRYYFPFGKIAWFPDVSYTVGSSTFYGPVSASSSGALISGKTTTSTKTFQGGVGASYFLNKSIGIEMLAYYSNSISDPDRDTQPKTTTTNLALRVGLQIYFAKGK